MTRDRNSAGAQELKTARRESSGLVVTTVLFSIAVNALMLTGPLYMLQVYDRVLGSGSEATLLALSVLVVGLFAAMGVLEYARGKVMAIVGARFQDRLDRRVFAAAMQRAALNPTDPTAMIAQRDLEAVRTFLSAPVLLAILDLPWTPLFVLAIFVFHPLLGWMAVGGGLFLICVTAINQVASRRPQKESVLATVRSERMSDQMKGEAETLQALGMTGAAFDRWQEARQLALQKGIAAAGLAGGLGALTKTFRLFLQSAMLGLGAWLVLRHELTAGAMIVASTLLGRGLAPIEMAVGQWGVAQRAHEGWHRLSELLTRAPQPVPRTALPRPRALLEVEGLTVAPPGEPAAILRMVSFRLEPGQAIGVIGSSGAGKSTLAKALTGNWQPMGGKIRLDGAALDQYDSDVLGRYFGYLPQRITLFDGTIAENIARLDPSPDSEQIIAAARAADAHEMILKLPNGYDTLISTTGGRLSGGQMQRVGLARALYGDPVLLILDEPNSNLDNEGSAALNAAIRSMKAAGKSVLIMAHRPAAIQECDFLLVLEGGVRKGFGPRDQILRELVKNHADIVRAPTPGASG